MWIIILTLISFLIFVTIAIAFSITPSFKDYDFVPNFTYTVKFTVYSDSEVDSSLSGLLQEVANLKKDKHPVVVSNVVV